METTAATTTTGTARALPARLLALLALQAGAVVAVAVASGKLDSGHAVGLAAAAVGVLATAAFAARVGSHAPARDEAGVAVTKRRDRTKTLLALTVLVGALAYFGGNGTYSSFNAETTNAGSTAASGTLTLSDTAQTQCLTMTGATNNNVNAQCGAILNLSTLAPGVYGGVGQVTLANTGTIDASKLYFWASQVNATLSSGLTAGNTVSSLPVTALEGTVTDGDSIVVSFGFHTQTFVASGVTAAGSTSITVTGQTANYAYPTNSTVTDTSSNTGVSTTLTTGLTSGNAVSSLAVSSLPKAVNNGDLVTVTSGSNTQTFTASATANAGAISIPVSTTTANFSYPTSSAVFDANNIDCYDQKTGPAGGSNGPTTGSDLNFDSPAGNPLCSQLEVFVQETTGGPTGGQHYCWYGNPVGTSVANAMCAAPISVNLTASVDSTTNPSTLPLAALNGNIRAGDTLKVTDGSYVLTCTVQSGSANDAYFGYTGNVNVQSCSSSPSSHTYPTTSIVTDSTMLSTLNSDSTHTLANFDTGHSYSGQVQLYPVTSDGTVNNSAPVELAKEGSSGSSRVFQVGVYLPAPGGINQNAIQGLSSTFGITWHMDQ